MKVRNLSKLLHCSQYLQYLTTIFLRKQPSIGILRKICIEFTGEHPCRSVTSVKLLCNFIEITLRHGCSENMH